PRLRRGSVLGGAAWPRRSRVRAKGFLSRTSPAAPREAAEYGPPAKPAPRTVSYSFIPQTNDRILLRGAIRRHDPEQDADRERHRERDEHGQERDDGLDARELLNSETQPAAHQDAGHAARDADQHRLAEKLKEDVLLRGTHRAAHADLADALEHRRQHDVHDPDPAHDERDRRDGAEDDVEDRLRALLLLEEHFRHRDLDVDRGFVPSLQHALHNRRDRRHVLRVVHAHDDLVELIAVHLFLARVLVLLRLALLRDDDGTRRQLDVPLRHLRAVAIAGED